MTLGNMRDLGVQRLIASVSTRRADMKPYPEETEVPSFTKKVVCAKCGARGRHIDVRPNWKEQTPQSSLTGKEWR